MSKTYVVKRSGKKEAVNLDKILHRVSSLSPGLAVDSFSVAQKVISAVHDGIETKVLDDLLAETAAVMTSIHPDYGKLAGKVAASSLHKETKPFYQTIKDLHKAGIVNGDIVKFVKNNAKQIDKEMDNERDFGFTYFGLQTLKRSYLLKINGKVVERPQYMFMRVAIAVAGPDPKEVFELYHLLSEGYYTHATPTLFNAGTNLQQLSSCFLSGIEDSIEGIYDGLKESALISKLSGGIGIHISNIRAAGSRIKGTNGVSNGIVPMLKVYEATMRYVNQGGKRPGSGAFYLEPWHADVEAFLELRKSTGKEQDRARDIFTALWVPDLFFKRLEADGDWTLFCPNEAEGLEDVFGKEFEDLYEKYEKEGLGRKTMKAKDLMAKIIESQIETGTPYIGAKDHVNNKTNQANIGIIRSSNLCIEVNLYSDANEHAVCNLASICLPRFVTDGKFDFVKLGKVVKAAIKNLDNVITINHYPTEKTRQSNMKHRPTGLGVQGLADVFFKLGLPFDSDEAKQLNKEIFECIYYHAVESSCDLAEKRGVYETFPGSPASKGLLQFDLWGVTPSDKYDWKKLKERVMEVGLRNSTLIALMPTASTAQIFDNTEAFEAQTSNMFKRKVLAGDFLVINKYLVDDLVKLGLWNEETKQNIILNNGSIQQFDHFPQRIKDIYKTVWEISQKDIIDMSADRGPYVCQSQSLNLFLAKPNFASVASMIFYGWKKGLKTIMYYLRTKPVTSAAKVTTEEAPVKACSIDNPDCESCSS
jgi:ribonucleoside-diphosphate reductase alpha chain